MPIFFFGCDDRRILPFGGCIMATSVYPIRPVMDYCVLLDFWYSLTEEKSQKNVSEALV